MTATNPLPVLPEHLAAIIDEDKPEDYSLHIPGRFVRMAGLTLAEKIVLAVVDNFHRNGRGCYASNRWFSERLSVGTREVTRIIDGLTAKGYLKTAQYRDPKRCGGRIRILQPSEQVPETITESASAGMDNMPIQCGQYAETAMTKCPDSIDKIAGESRHARAYLEPVLNPVDKQETTTPLPPATPSDPVERVVVSTVTDTERLQTEDEAYRLLGCVDGGLGLRDDVALHVARTLPLQEIKARLIWAKRDGKNPAAYFQTALREGWELPEDCRRAAVPVHYFVDRTTPEEREKNRQAEERRKEREAREGPPPPFRPRIVLGSQERLEPDMTPIGSEIHAFMAEALSNARIRAGLASPAGGS